jgi:hypothetical protein
VVKVLVVEQIPAPDGRRETKMGWEENSMTHKTGHLGTLQARTKNIDWWGKSQVPTGATSLCGRPIAKWRLSQTFNVSVGVELFVPQYCGGSLN